MDDPSSFICCSNIGYGFARTVRCPGQYNRYTKPRKHLTPSRSRQTYDVDPGRERNGGGRHSIAGVQQSSSDLFCAESAGRMPRTQHHRGVQQRRLRLSDAPTASLEQVRGSSLSHRGHAKGGMAPHRAARPQGRLTNAPSDVKLPRDKSAARVRFGNPPEPRPTRCGHPNRVSLDSPQCAIPTRRPPLPALHPPRATPQPRPFLRLRVLIRSSSPSTHTPPNSPNMPAKVEIPALVEHKVSPRAKELLQKVPTAHSPTAQATSR